MFQDLIIQYLIDKFIFLHSDAVKTDYGYRCRCRVCGDSKVSDKKVRLNYYSASNSLFCFNCNFSGSLLKYLSHIEGKTQHELKAEILKDNKIKLHTKPKVSKKQKEELKDISSINNIDEIKETISHYSAIPDKVVEYLKSRKIFDAPFFDKSTNFLWDDNRKRIVIPWYYNNLPIYYQSRRFSIETQPKYLFPKKYRVLFYNADKLDRNIPYLFICESALDSIFVRNGIASGSINLTGLQKELLQKHFSQYQIILMCDNPFVDDAGQKMIERLSQNNSNIKIFILPEQLRKYKDINEVCIGENNINIFNNVNFLLQNTHSIGKVLTMLKFK